jgi:hypothetical protein
MKKTLLVALVAILILVLASASTAQPTGAFAYVDFLDSQYDASVNVDVLVSGFASVSSDCAPGTNGFRVVYLLGEGYDAECQFAWTGRQKARKLVLKVYDKWGWDDSFEVYSVIRGSYKLIYSYTDVEGVGDDQWHEHAVTRFQYERGKNPRLTIKIVSNPWPQPVPSCGQVAVDWIALYETKN